MKKGDRLLKKTLWIFLALLCSPAIAFCQPQSDASSASQSSQQSSSQTQPQQKRARQMERRKRALYPCPARTKNAGTARPAACSTGSPPQNNELRRKKTRSRSWGTAALTSPRE